MTLLEQLVEIRQRRNKAGQPGYRQVDVAKAMGVGQPSVSELERGETNPRLDTILRYASAINVQVNFEVIDNGNDEEGS
jgi:transcriptional regulator with XRE-family HTH domain